MEGARIKGENRAFVLGVVMLFALGLSGCSCGPSKYAELTAQCGPELRKACEDFHAAVIVAYETGDVSQLQDTATGYVLDEITRTAGYEEAKSIAEWYKVEIQSLRVHDCSEVEAEIVVDAYVVGNVSGSRRLSRIYKFQKDGNQWKVYSILPITDR